MLSKGEHRLIKFKFFLSVICVMCLVSLGLLGLVHVIFFCFCVGSRNSSLSSATSVDSSATTPLVQTDTSPAASYSVPWMKVLTKPPFWSVCVCLCCFSYCVLVQRTASLKLVRASVLKCQNAGGLFTDLSPADWLH